MTTEYEIPREISPTDGITTVLFANNSNLLLASSWDKCVRLYDTGNNTLKDQYERTGGILDCAFTGDDEKCFSGGIDRELVLHDFKTSDTSVIGQHDKPIRCVEFYADQSLAITGSWDKTVKLWDTRSTVPCIKTLQQPGKVFAMCISGYRLVVGTSDRHVMIFDLRRPDQPEQQRVSSLKHQTRCIKSFPHANGYALSSIEGRAAVEYFDPSALVQQRKYAFKCHRSTVKGVQYVFPVNAIAFHPTYGTFATGGCDGIVSIWDGGHKKRVCQFPTYPSSISSLSFNHDGTLLAVASSYTFEEGDKEHLPDSIFIRQINDPEVRPKEKSTK